MNDEMNDILDFYRGKKIFVTGHTGFKGSWLCKILIDSGADVTGYSLEAPTNPSLFKLSGISGKMISLTGDVRDSDSMNKAFNECCPEIVFHLAAQPLVREGYISPVYTYETNVMGTVNILECLRHSKSVRSFLNVTTDKVYKNREWMRGYREDDELDGFDPYSNSKSCSELVTHSYKNSFFTDGSIAISTARAGNVIGGGDFSADRIIPDCVRAASKNEILKVRNPGSVRPYQHVLEPLSAYLMITATQYNNSSSAGYYNVGPDESDSITTQELVKIFASEWGEGFSWESCPDNGPHEAGFLKLDSTKMKNVFGWKPKWNIKTAVSKTVEWSKVYHGNADVSECMENQISEYFI